MATGPEVSTTSDTVAMKTAAIDFVNKSRIRFSPISEKNASSRAVGHLDRRAIPAPLGGAVLNLSYLGHGAEQPDSRRHQQDEKHQQQCILDVATTLVLRWLRRWSSSVCHPAN
jgi:hypothetical protein